MNPLSFEELSVQERSIRLEEAPLAVRLLGAAGIVGHVVAEAVFEYAEVPAVIFDIQRVGPSTGMPTRTQQCDLMECAYASHGDTRHVCLYPANPEECFYMAAQAFDLTERLQTPVMIRYGELTEDEVFVSHDAARQGVQFDNNGGEPLVTLRYFGPGTNPQAPNVGDHKKR